MGGEDHSPPLFVSRLWPEKNFAVSELRTDQLGLGHVHQPPESSFERMTDQDTALLLVAEMDAKGWLNTQIFPILG